MRRVTAIGALVVLLLGGVGIGVSAYRAGERKGIAEGIEQVQAAQAGGQGVQVVHVVDGGPFFFPGFFLFPLFVFGAFFLIGRIFRGGGRWGGGRYGPGPWNDEGRRRFEERAEAWHRTQHGETPPAPPQAAS
jgi:hypothetical protein